MGLPQGAVSTGFASPLPSERRNFKKEGGADGGVCRAGPGCVLFLDTGTQSCISVAKCDWPTPINVSRWRFREGGGEKRKRHEGP